MESVAAHAQVGKKTLDRRWASKAPLVAEAAVEAYGGRAVSRRRDRRRPRRPADVARRARRILGAANERRFGASPRGSGRRSPGRGRGSVSPVECPAARGADDSAPQRRRGRELRPDTDIDAVATAIVGTMLLHALTQPGGGAGRQFGGLLGTLSSTECRHLVGDKKARIAAEYLATSCAPINSRAECIASCAAPTSTVGMPVRAAASGPIVDPHGRSARCS